MTQEFQISVTPVGTDEYLVRTERVAPGVPLAEAQIVWPLEAWLTQAHQLMHDPLMGLLQGNPSHLEGLAESSEGLPHTHRNLVALGKELYNCLFQDRLRDSWIMAQAIAQHRREKLRLRLGLKGNRLPRLPWEVLHNGDRTLATGTEVLFSRYQPTVNGLPLPELRLQSTSRYQPLQILMVVAAPSDRESLELKQEAMALQRELRNRSDTGSPSDIQLEILEQPDRTTLTQKLEQGQYQVLHYAGHSSLGESGGAVYLVNGKTGLTEPLTGEDLAGLLVNNGIQMAVFNSCRGAYTDRDESLEEGERNLAEALVKRGIPGVLAMAERIPDEVALNLTRLFYRNLNQGYPIDLSLSRARQGLISAYGSNQLYWALPILYMHPQFDGYLTNRPPAQDFGVATDSTASQPSPMEMPPMEIDESIDEATLEGVLNEIEYPDLSEMEEDKEGDAKKIVASLLQELTPPKRSTELPLTESLGDEQPADDGWFGSSEPHLETPLSQTLPSSPLETPLTQALSTSEAEQKSRSGFQKARQRLASGSPWLFSSMAVAAIALVGVGTLLLKPQSEPPTTVPPVSPTTPFNPEVLPTAERGTLLEIAAAQFAQGNLSNGQLAIETLLDRNDLEAAKASLALVPKEETNNPAILFLSGRLRWQYVRTGNSDYSIDDARRDWETALKKQPDSPHYQEAFGFALYAENKFDEAYQFWKSALELAEQEVVVGEKEAQQSQTILNIKAGLALALMKSAQRQSPADTEKLNQAIDLRQRVLNADLEQFTPKALSQNWLWTEAAIKDWEELWQLQRQN